MKIKDLIYYDFKNAEFYANGQNGCAESPKDQRK